MGHLTLADRLASALPAMRHEAPCLEGEAFSETDITPALT